MSIEITPQERQGIIAALQAEKIRRAKQLTERFKPYRDDPAGFVENILLGYVWSKQREICESVAKHRRTAVKSAHDTGKSAIAARIGAWWLSCYDPGESFLVSLAPTGHQVKAILWREINKVHAAGGLPGRVNQTEWYHGTEIVGFGRSPRDTDPTAIQGIHAPRVLLVLDEACGIGKALWDAADSLIANEDSRALAIGNPDDPSTEFSEICKPGSGWNVITISAFDTPNFTKEDVPAWLKPLLVSQTWVAEKKRKWGEGSPIYISKVLGEFPDQSSDGLVPIKTIRAALERDDVEGDANELGIDIARFGGDSSVCWHRKGGTARRLWSTQKRELMDTTGRIVVSIKETGATRIKIDDIGMGGGVVDRLHEVQRQGGLPGDITIVGVNVGEGATEEEPSLWVPPADERFANLRAELNWQMREVFMTGKIALRETEAGDADDLAAQAGQVKYMFTSKGKIQIEPKKDMKKRTKGVSPDDWDALVLTWAPGDDETTLWKKAYGV